ncbi:MAG: T9SS type A sorting domain-containing protein [Flavobacteriales bacterium]|nr:T9SS type A sorting domain-containing protein [Flavobacteriales bacterium]MCB0784243.1 T9SS type A sorting domain-containing protein [Flavobacteriales bacterium]MCB0788090.1 T9SS type A sorting domain-containing protein [Flavobacteriales bacterium]MCB0807661.1 T9SS type A sorting domain-containing protein [Flavobacteriales bacterium]MCB0813469.1 T9SS type A sorting domain-containing protein [Flavobacteriales bacterium]
MKHVAALLFSTLLLTVPDARAQLAELHDADGNVVNGQTVVHWGDMQTANQKQGLDVVLLGSATKVVNVKRYELSVQTGTENYFCWGVCYTPVDAGSQPFWQAQSQHSIVLDPGVPEDAFGAYHTPNGMMGSSIYRYVWFDVNAPSDSVWVDIEFRVTAVGVEEEATSVQEFVLFPNPVLGREFSLRYGLSTTDVNGLEFVLHDAVGQQVMRQRLSSVSGRVAIGVEGLPSGVYFATLERQGAQLRTERLVLGSR